MPDKPKFNFGDYIYAAAAEQTEKWAPCPLCLGKMYVNIIFQGESFDLDCPECERGHLGSTGSKQTWVFGPTVREGKITRVEKGSWEPFEIEYMISAGPNSGYIIKESDAFATKEEALGRSFVLAEERAVGEAKKIDAKERPNKKWAWNVNYHKQQIKHAQRDQIPPPAHITRKQRVTTPQSYVVSFA